MIKIETVQVSQKNSQSQFIENHLKLHIRFFHLNLKSCPACINKKIKSKLSDFFRGIYVDNFTIQVIMRSIRNILQYIFCVHFKSFRYISCDNKISVYISCRRQTTIQERHVNSLAPGRCYCNWKMCAFQTQFTYWYLENYLRNYSHMNATRPHGWSANDWMIFR